MLLLRFSLSNGNIIERVMKVNQHIQCIIQHSGDSLEKINTPFGMLDV